MASVGKFAHLKYSRTINFLFYLIASLRRGVRRAAVFCLAHYNRRTTLHSTATASAKVSIRAERILPVAACASSFIIFSASAYRSYMRGLVGGWCVCEYGKLIYSTSIYTFDILSFPLTDIDIEQENYFLVSVRCISSHAAHALHEDLRDNPEDMNFPGWGVKSEEKREIFWHLFHVDHYDFYIILYIKNKNH